MEIERAFSLSWFEIRSTRRNYYTDNIHYNVFAVGKWAGHIMDWRGCNFWHKKVNDRYFKSISEAFDWIQGQLDNGTFSDNMTIDGGGHLSENREPMLEEKVVHISKDNKAYYGSD